MSERTLNNAAYLDLASIHPDDLDLSKLEASVSNWHLFDKIGRDELLSNIHQFDVVISNKVVLDADVIEQADKLKLICVSATGINNIDMVAAQKKGITVCNVQAYATASVVQHVFSMILTLVTQLDESRLAVADARWRNSENFCVLGIPIMELNDKCIGIVGYGELGRAVANVARAFGMNVLIAKRNLEDDREARLPLHELLSKVDILSLHCPLNEQTRGLIGANEIAMMKPGALLINTSRGGLVDEAALLEALTQKQIAGAGLDVLEQEPPSGDNQLINAKLNNLIITPHVAWASNESRQRLVDELVKNIAAYIQGEPRNVVIHP